MLLRRNELNESNRTYSLFDNSIIKKKKIKCGFLSGVTTLPGWVLRVIDKF